MSLLKSHEMLSKSAAFHAKELRFTFSFKMSSMELRALQGGSALDCCISSLAFWGPLPLGFQGPHPWTAAPRVSGSRTGAQNTCRSDAKGAFRSCRPAHRARTFLCLLWGSQGSFPSSSLSSCGALSSYHLATGKLPFSYPLTVTSFGRHSLFSSLCEQETTTTVSLIKTSPMDSKEALNSYDPDTGLAQHCSLLALLSKCRLSAAAFTTDI